MASIPLNENQLPWLGDHLWIHKKGYTHHALYIGEDDQGEPIVAHYSGWVEGFRSGPLELEHLDVFSQGKTIYIRKYSTRMHSRETSVARVLDRLGENKYNVHSNNCEHLCHWAIMGDPRSTQVEWVNTVLGAIHPGLEAASKGIATFGQAKPHYITPGKKAAGDIAKTLVVDWGLKSAARWVAGPVGIAAYVGYRVSKQVISHKRAKP
jgi:hypothetical protein